MLSSRRCPRPRRSDVVQRPTVQFLISASLWTARRGYKAADTGRRAGHRRPQRANNAAALEQAAHEHADSPWPVVPHPFADETFADHADKFMSLDQCRQIVEIVLSPQQRRQCDQSGATPRDRRTVLPVGALHVPLAPSTCETLIVSALLLSSLNGPGPLTGGCLDRDQRRGKGRSVQGARWTAARNPACCSSCALSKRERRFRAQRTSISLLDGVGTMVPSAPAVPRPASRRSVGRPSSP